MVLAAMEPRVEVGRRELGRGRLLLKLSACNESAVSASSSAKREGGGDVGGLAQLLQRPDDRLLIAPVRVERVNAERRADLQKGNKKVN